MPVRFKSNLQKKISSALQRRTFSIYVRTNLLPITLWDEKFWNNKMHPIVLVATSFAFAHARNQQLLFCHLFSCHLPSYKLLKSSHNQLFWMHIAHIHSFTLTYPQPSQPLPHSPYSHILKCTKTCDARFINLGKPRVCTECCVLTSYLECPKRKIVNSPNAYLNCSGVPPMIWSHIWKTHPETYHALQKKKKTHLKRALKFIKTDWFGAHIFEAMKWTVL